MDIENSVPNYFLSTFVNSINIFDCDLSGKRQSRHMYGENNSNNVNNRGQDIDQVSFLDNSEIKLH